MTAKKKKKKKKSIRTISVKVVHRNRSDLTVTGQKDGQLVGGGGGGEEEEGGRQNVAYKDTGF